MDSVKRAIWGDGTQPNETGGQEPVSGQTGNTAAGEPYDAGNLSGTTGDSTTTSSTLNPTSSTSTGNASTSNTTGIDPTSSHHSSTIPGSATHPSNTTQSDPTKDLSTATSNNLTSSRDRENLTEIPSGGAQRLQSQDTPNPSAPSHQALMDLNRESGGVTSSSSAGTGTGTGIATTSSGTGNIDAGGVQGTDHRTSAPTPHAVSSAGAGKAERATEKAGGVQGSKSGSGSAAAAEDSSGPPAQEIKFTQKEIDEAANVNVSHENPHTIGNDGKEEGLEECGGAGDEKMGEGKGGKGGKGGKMEKIKEKLHLGGKS